MAKLDKDGLAALDGALLGHADDTTPGLVALVAVGEEVHVTAEGRRHFGAAPMERDTIFRIASMTKPPAAAAAMMLVEDGRLALDEPVGRLLPEFARPRVGGRGTSGYWDPRSGLVGIHLTQRVMESPDPTAVFTDFWTRARAAAGV